MPRTITTTERTRPARIAARLGTAKLSMAADASDPTFLAVPVTHGSVVVARVSLSSTPTSFTLDVHPAGEGSTALVGHWLNVPALPDARTDEEDSAIDGCEALFRVLMVNRGAIPRREAPTTHALLGVVRDLAAVPQRSVTSRNLVWRAVELIGSTSAPSKVRRTALDLVGACAALRMDAATWAEEPELGIASNKARIVTTTAFERLSRQWETGSHVGWLLPDAPASEPEDDPVPPSP